MKGFGYGLVCVICLVLFCCNEDSTIGSNLIGDANLNVVYTDTLTLKISTVILDNLPTASPSRFLIGAHLDQDLGNIVTRPFFQVYNDVGAALDKTTTTYSRTELRIINDGYSYYDTTKTVTIKAHKITDEFALESDGYLYNHSSFSYDPTPLGTVTILSKPHRRDTVKIPIIDALGKQIVTFAQTSAPPTSTSDEFIKFLQGIVLVSDSTSSGPILGFSRLIELRVYYIDQTTTPPKERYISFTTGTRLSFNQIHSDRSATGLNSLVQQRYDLSSTLTNNTAFVQGGIGLGIRIEIPYLRRMAIENPSLIVSNAVLELSPLKETVEKNVPRQTGLVASGIGYRNAVFETLSSNAFLLEDYYLGRDTKYAANVKAFVVAQLKLESVNNNAILLTLGSADLASTVNRLRLGDQKNPLQAKIKVYSITFQK